MRKPHGSRSGPRTAARRGIDQEGDGRPDGYAVVYESPSQGTVEFDWHGPLVVAGQEVPLAGYPRYDNPFVHTPFGEDRYEVALGKHSLVLDFATNECTAAFEGRCRLPYLGGRRGRPGPSFPWSARR